MCYPSNKLRREKWEWIGKITYNTQNLKKAECARMVDRLVVTVTSIAVVLSSVSTLDKTHSSMLNGSDLPHYR